MAKLLNPATLARRVAILTTLVGAILGFGCRNESAKQKQSPESAPKAAVPCPQQSAELRTWLQALFDGKPTSPPWPTGDAVFDAELHKRRERLRELNKPFDPSQERLQLEEGRKPGLLERALAGCEPAMAQLGKVNEAAPAQQPTAWTGLADAIAACDCKPNITQVKAVLYLMYRGPD